VSEQVKKSFVGKFYLACCELDPYKRKQVRQREILPFKKLNTMLNVDTFVFMTLKYLTFVSRLKNTHHQTVLKLNFS